MEGPRPAEEKRPSVKEGLCFLLNFQILADVSEMITRAAGTKVAGKLLEQINPFTTPDCQPLTEATLDVLKNRVDPEWYRKLFIYLRQWGIPSVCIAGPSGAGKTHLYDCLRARIARRIESTSKMAGTNLFTTNSLFSLVDTVGRQGQGDFVSESVTAVCNSEVVILVFAAGFLKALDGNADGFLEGKLEYKHLELPVSIDLNSRKKDHTLESYLTQCRAVELRWLQTLIHELTRLPAKNGPWKKQRRRLFVFVNKADLWFKSMSEVKARYLEGLDSTRPVVDVDGLAAGRVKFGLQLQELRKLLNFSDPQTYLMVGSAGTSDFAKQRTKVVPPVQMNGDYPKLSMRLLEAALWNSLA